MKKVHAFYSFAHYFFTATVAPELGKSYICWRRAANPALELQTERGILGKVWMLLCLRPEQISKSISSSHPEGTFLSIQGPKAPSATTPPHSWDLHLKYVFVSLAGRMVPFLVCCCCCCC